MCLHPFVHTLIKQRFIEYLVCAYLVLNTGDQSDKKKHTCSYLCVDYGPLVGDWQNQSHNEIHTSKLMNALKEKSTIDKGTAEET